MKRLSYEHFEIELIDGKFTRAALITSGYPTQFTLDTLKEFISKFEAKYTKQLKKFYGNISIFSDSEKLINEVYQFNSS